MKNALKYFFTKIKDHRQTSRLWFEGTRLNEAGFLPGKMYRVEIDKDSDEIKIILDEAGDRIVSKRKRRGTDKVTPIIDICRKDIAPAGTRIQAKFEEGLITVTLHHEDEKQRERESRLTEVAKGNAVLREATICCGIGVSTAAVHETFKENGIDSKLEWVVEADGSYLQIADENNSAFASDVTLIEGYLEEVHPEMYSEIDALSFSLPCDVHSLAGKSKNGNKEAEDLAKGATVAFGLINAVKASNPSVIKSENVVEAKDSAIYKMIRAELERMGYVIHEYVLDGKTGGALEQRSRYYFLAVSKGVERFFEFDQIPTFPRIHANMGDVLEDIPFDSEMWADNQYLKDKAVRDAKAGKGFANRPLLTAESEKCTVINKYYYKRQSTGAFVTRPEDGKERLLTVNEVCDVMRIPHELVKDVPYCTAIAGLGQSVTYTNVKAITQVICNAIKRLGTSLQQFNPATPLCI